jgi:hypothetical protein
LFRYRNRKWRFRYLESGLSLGFRILTVSFSPLLLILAILILPFPLTLIQQLLSLLLIHIIVIRSERIIHGDDAVPFV